MEKRLLRKSATMLMMVLLNCTTILAFAPSPVLAQRVRAPVGAVYTHFTSGAPLPAEREFGARLGQPRGASGEKDPFVAGVLSAIVPGVGSFYAGNSGHGLRHVIIHIGSYAVLSSAALSCTGDCKSNAAVAGVSALALIGNGIWSIFTAVGDARATRPTP